MAHFLHDASEAIKIATAAQTRTLWDGFDAVPPPPPPPGLSGLVNAQIASGSVLTTDALSDAYEALCTRAGGYARKPIPADSWSAPPTFTHVYERNPMGHGPDGKPHAYVNPTPQDHIDLHLAEVRKIRKAEKRRRKTAKRLKREERENTEQYEIAIDALKAIASTCDGQPAVEAARTLLLLTGNL